MTNSFLQNIGAPGVQPNTNFQLVPPSKTEFKKKESNKPKFTPAPKTPPRGSIEESLRAASYAKLTGRQLPPNYVAPHKEGEMYNNPPAPEAPAKPMSLYDLQELTRPIDINMPEALQNSPTLTLDQLRQNAPTGNERWTPSGYVTPGEVGPGGYDHLRDPLGRRVGEHYSESSVANQVDQKPDPTADEDQTYEGPQQPDPTPQTYASSAVNAKIAEERSARNGEGPAPWSRTPGTGQSVMEQQAAELRAGADALANRYIEPDDDYSGNGAKGSKRLDAALNSVTNGGSSQESGASAPKFSAETNLGVASMPEGAPYSVSPDRFGTGDAQSAPAFNTSSALGVAQPVNSGESTNPFTSNSTRVNAQGVIQKGMDMSWKDSQNAPRFVDTPTDNATSNVTYSPTGEDDDQSLVDFNSSWSTMTQPGQFPTQFGMFQ